MIVRHNHTIEFKTQSWEELCKQVNCFMQEGFLVEEISTNAFYGNDNLVAVDYYVKMVKKEIGEKYVSLY